MHPELLAALPQQGVASALPRFLLAAGELPQPAQGLGVRSLGREHAGGRRRVVKDRGPDHARPGGPAGHGVSRRSVTTPLSARRCALAEA